MKLLLIFCVISLISPISPSVATNKPSNYKKQPGVQKLNGMANSTDDEEVKKRLGDENSKAIHEYTKLKEKLK